MGIYFPPQRAACYSADLVTRQYAVESGQAKKEINYSSIQPVYTIIILEKSSGAFTDSNECIHHFSQKSDTDVELELLQYYDYVCLDNFQKSRPHIGAELRKWLDFLTITDRNEMISFFAENLSFQLMYNCDTMLYRDRRERPYGEGL
jgi:hypothetical protein